MTKISDQFSNSVKTIDDTRKNILAIMDSTSNMPSEKEKISWTIIIGTLNEFEETLNFSFKRHAENPQMGRMADDFNRLKSHVDESCDMINSEIDAVKKSYSKNIMQRLSK